MAQESAELLVIENVSKTFDGRRVLDNFSATLSTGKILGLIGKSAAGKSVLIHMLRGSEEYAPDEGRVIYNVNRCCKCGNLDLPFAGKPCSKCGGETEKLAVDYWSLKPDDSLRQAKAISERLLDEGRAIRIVLDENAPDGYINVCYDDSVMLKRLSAYPYIQLGVVMLFVVVAIFALLTSKRAEQNKVWVGLSKETAHQLGTPISSLMAWVEILKESYPDDTLIPEMDKDVKRLELIADRFSKIGSLPEPVPASLVEVMQHVIDYMDRRTSQKVEFIKDFPKDDITVKMNASLFEWVIENLCKNAVDAMEGSGTITLHMEETADKAIIEVADTGKGIRKKDLRNVFRPGFTTKKRGWGLGLSLAKRIVEEYHKGRIFVKSSEPGKGTTFRIELRK